MSSVFRFKQFNVDQSGCAMKINTDGVLLGALSQNDNPKTILDIGAGTGVIALMLAQRFAHANIDAVEIDEQAAETAAANFNNSPFADRLACHHASFKQYFSRFPDSKFDLIVSNPPFFLNSLKNPNPKKEMARHTDADFFEKLFALSADHLSGKGKLWLILPYGMFDTVQTMADDVALYHHHHIAVHSFKEDLPHRSILSFGKQPASVVNRNFIIYQAPKVYSSNYVEALKPFFTIF